MRSYVVPVLLMASLLVAGSALTCKNVVQSVSDHRVASEWQAARIDTFSPGVKVSGIVYYKGHPQDGAAVKVAYGGGRDWEDTTQDGGKYEFLVQFSGIYTIQACYGGRFNRGPDCEGGKYEFVVHSSADSVYLDLCIGSGGYCPYPKCR